MSPEKLAKVRAGILKDFEPWLEPNRAYLWGGASVDLSIEQMHALPPLSVFLALVTFSRFPYYGKSEKIAWSIPILFKGAPHRSLMRISALKFTLLSRRPGISSRSGCLSIDCSMRCE